MPRLLVVLSLFLAASPFVSLGDAQILAGRAVVGRHAEGAVVMTADGISTTAGRAEILFADGALLHVDVDTRVRWEQSGGLTLDHGRLLLRSGMGGWLDVALPFARVTLAPGGSYGFLVDAPHARLLVSVAQGAADLRTSAAQGTIGPSQMVVLTDQATRIVPTAFEPAPWDTFLRWSRARQAGRALAAAASTRPQVTGATMIPLGPGGYREGAPTVEPNPSTRGVEGGWLSSCPYGGCGAIVGWPAWRPDDRGRGWDRKDPYAPRYEPRYEPHDGGRGSWREGAGSVRGTGHGEGPARPATPPAANPPPPPMPSSQPAAKGSSGGLRVPGAPAGPTSPPAATRPSGPRHD